MLLLLITVMIVDVIENGVFWVPSHHSWNTGAPEEQTNGKYGKQRLHAKANQIVVIVHFSRPVPSPPPPNPPPPLPPTERHTCMQSYSCTYWLPRVSAAAKFTIELPDVLPPAHPRPKKNSHSCTLDDEDCSASQVLHSFIFILFFSYQWGPPLGLLPILVT